MALDHERINAQLVAALDLVEKNRKRLERAMRDEKLLDTTHVRLAADLAKASVDLSREARAWAKTSKDVGQKLTLQERIDLAVQFVQKLTPTDRREFIQRLSIPAGVTLDD